MKYTSTWVSLFAALTLSACVNSGSTVDSDLERRKSAAQLSSQNEGDLRVVDKLPTTASLNSDLGLLVAQNDLLEVDVFQVDELDKEVRVNPNGSISLPLIGSVPAAGKSIPQLEAEIEKRYGSKYLQNPEVSVFMKESAGQRITMDGEFSKPGIYQSDTQTTLLKAVALAGGMTELADEQKLFVFRQIGEQKFVANFSIEDIRQGKIGDPRIQGGDVIIAFQSGRKVATRNLREALGIAVNASRLAVPL